MEKSLIVGILFIAAAFLSALLRLSGVDSDANADDSLTNTVETESPKTGDIER